VAGVFGRSLRVDALRGIAIILMLFEHAPLFLLANRTLSPLMSYSYFFSRVSTPLFLLIAGYCLWLSGERRVPSAGKAGFLRHVLRRVLLIFLLGFLVDFFTFRSLLFLNVLHTIGLSLLFLSLLYVSGSVGGYFLTLCSALFYCFLYPPVFPEVFVRSPGGVLIWLMASGEYPLGSWMVYALLGFGVGRILTGVRFPAEWLPHAGLALVCASLLCLAIGYPIGAWNSGPPFLFAALGFALWAFYVATFLCGHRRGAFFAGALASFGRHSLPVYIVNMFLFSFAGGLAGLKNSLDSARVLAAFVLFVCLSYAAIRWIESRGRAGKKN